MSEPHQAVSAMNERRDLITYVVGFVLALILTLVPFALVKWSSVPVRPLLYVIGVLALVQILVHFRCFLHIGLRRQREDLLLILFSSLLLIIMIGGTIWIMTSLAGRMMLPPYP
ncbi:MAG: cytochrome o ubiquinol oxidase subunit IV [Pseudonocardiaceae bacterium]